MNRHCIKAGIIAAALAPGFCAAAVLPDPTRPFTYVGAVKVDQDGEAGGVQWRLSGIRIREEERSAILNGRIVRIGDAIGGAVLTEINASGVVLSQDRRRVEVPLLASEVKRPAGTPAKQ